MRLGNFQIASSLELPFEGELWDLHNGANFLGLQLLPSDNTAVMNWSSTTPPRLLGRHGVKLLFEGVQFVQISARDTAWPLTEDTCLADILKVDPNLPHADPRLRAISDFSDHFRLLFCFQSRRIIEIGSATVKLIPVSGKDPAETHLL